MIENFQVCSWLCFAKSKSKDQKFKNYDSFELQQALSILRATKSSDNPNADLVNADLVNFVSFLML